MSIEDAKLSNVPNGFYIKHVIDHKTCAYCKEKYEVRTYDVEYKVKLKGKIYTFCSWTHKCRFIKEHEKELKQER